MKNGKGTDVENVEAARSSSRKRGRPKTGKLALHVTTNLPDVVPILTGEIELIAAWWPDLFHILNDNDNKDTVNGDA